MTVQENEGKVLNMPKRKKVALLGTVPHKLKAPFNNGEFEIWAIAHACLGDPLPRVDRIFEIHKWDEVIKYGSPQAWAMHPNAPVYIIEKRDDVPNSIAFPFDELAKKFVIFPDRKECNMTNSISWMIALAIDEGFEEIHIYGVNMSHHTEYCVAPETMVLMKDLTEKKANDVNIGDEVIAFDEEMQNGVRKFKIATVEKNEKLKRPSYKLYLSNGKEIVCSAEHRWLVGDSKWVETQNLSNQMLIQIPILVKNDDIFTGEEIKITKKEFIGEMDVIALKTTTGTFIAEGFASHNSTQKPSCEYYLGLAKGMGIKIYVPPESDLMKSYFLYGLDEEKQSEFITRITDHQNFLMSQFNNISAQGEQIRDAKNQHVGAIEACKFFLGVFKH